MNGNVQMYPTTSYLSTKTAMYRQDLSSIYKETKGELEIRE